MKHKALKIVSAALCAVLLCGSVVGVLALGGEKSSSEQEEIQKETAAVLKKDETVYVLAGADGSTEKIIVSDWIQNPQGAATVTENGKLDNVRPTKGDAVYTLNEDGMRVWETKGEDVYLRGESKEELPVGIAVSYELDGKNITADELAGKSGHVKIRFSYENRTSATVTVNGAKETVHVPFAMLTGVLLDGDVFSNVSVSGGKLVNDGSRFAVVGVAFPGLAEDLQLDTEKYTLPQTVEIEADTTSFALGNTFTLATSSVFSALDDEKFAEADQLKASLAQLNDAMKALLDGSSALYDGLCTLLQKSDTLAGGIEALANGADTLQENSVKLNAASGQISSGAAELSDGLGLLMSKNDELNAGAKQVYQTLLSAVEEKVNAIAPIDALTIENYKDVLGALVDTPSAAQQAALIAAAQKTLEEKVAAQGVPQAQYETAKFILCEAMAGGASEESAAQTLSSLLSHAVLYQTVAAQYPQGTQEQIVFAIAVSLTPQGGDPSEYLEAAAAVAADAAAYAAKAQDAQSEQGKALVNGVCLASAKAQAKVQIDAALEQLSQYDAFYTGLRDYTAGVDSAKSGAEKLSAGALALLAGTDAFKDGMSTLSGGAKELRDAVPALKSGIRALRDGANTLYQGLGQFDEEGVQKLTEAAGGIEKLAERFRAVSAAAEQYRSFSGENGGDAMESTVKFIYRTEEITAD